MVDHVSVARKFPVCFSPQKRAPMMVRVPRSASTTIQVVKDGGAFAGEGACWPFSWGPNCSILGGAVPLSPRLGFGDHAPSVPRGGGLRDDAFCSQGFPHFRQARRRSSMLAPHLVHCMSVYAVDLPPASECLGDHTVIRESRVALSIRIAASRCAPESRVSSHFNR